MAKKREDGLHTEQLVKHIHILQIQEVQGKAGSEYRGVEFKERCLREFMIFNINKWDKVNQGTNLCIPLIQSSVKLLPFLFFSR